MARHIFINRIGKNKAIEEDVSVIESEIERMDGIIKQFLDFSRPGFLCISKVDVNRVLKDTFGLLSYELKEQKISVAKIFDNNIPEINADSERLKQVFLNIVLNSIQACPFGGKFTVKTECLNGYVLISIKDTGKGTVVTIKLPAD